MLENLNRRSPLTGALKSGIFGAPGDPGVTITERRDLTIVEVAVWMQPTAVAMKAFVDAVGIALPLQPNTSATLNDISLLWSGPGRWLAVGPTEPDGLHPENLRQQLPDDFLVLDLSHSRRVIRIEGSAARDVLAKGIPFDIHESTFSPGACGQSHISDHIGVLLHLVDPSPRFDIYASRSYAMPCWQWLIDSAAQFGYRVV
jgi:sarcosine oxidase subunit gamma